MQSPLTDDYIADIFARAITSVARREYERLKTGLRPFEVMERLTQAQMELNGLKRREMPDYEDWTSLCYLTWYQAHHINLAYTIVDDWSSYIRKTLDDSESFGGFRWIDFGCGSLPMHMSLCALSALGRVSPYLNSPIFGIGIDKSRSMLRIGRAVVSAINRLDPRLTHGSENLATFASVEDYSRSGFPIGNVPSILSVMHAFYPENISDVSLAIQSLIETTHPELIIVTSHPDSETMAGDVFSPYLDRYDRGDRRYDHSQLLRFNGQLEAITALREQWAEIVEIERVDTVNEGLSAQRDYAGINDFGLIHWDGVSRAIREKLVGPDVQFIDDTDTAIKYLNGEVTWSGSEVAAQVYYRKQ